MEMEILTYSTTASSLRCIIDNSAMGTNAIMLEKTGQRQSSRDQEDIYSPITELCPT